MGEDTGAGATGQRTLRTVEIGDGVVGCVLGLALGDALGAPFEFQRRERIPQPLPQFELPWNGVVGATTDDTAMARNLVRSLIERGGFDPEDIARRHVEWFLSRPPDVGSLTRRVLARAARGELAEDAARAVWEERGPEVSAGNGSVMYCAPLGAAFARRPEELFDVAPQLSAITHYDERCRTAVLAVTLAAAALVRGEARRDAVVEAVKAVSDREGGEELEYLVDAAGRTRRIDGPDMGFCLFTAGVGLQAAAGDASFEEELVRVVGYGGDTDTNAAVAGALVGAAVGREALPEAWLAKLADRDEIEREGEALVQVIRSGDRDS